MPFFQKLILLFMIGLIAVALTIGVIDNFQPVKNMQVSSIAIGGSHTLYLLQNGDVYVSGSNEFGQLGLNDTKYLTVPVKNPHLSHIKQIVAGEKYSIALTNNGDILLFGIDPYIELKYGQEYAITKINIPEKIYSNSDIKSITTMGNHILILLNSGDVYVYGDNSFGQLGVGDTKKRYMIDNIKNISNVSIISAGFEYSIIVLENGDIYSFGRGDYGQTGLNTTQNILIPTKIENITNIVQITSGYYNTLLLLENGDVYSFGNNEGGQLGLNNTNMCATPTKIKNISNASKVITRGYNSYILLKNGDVYVIGWNKGYLLGSTKYDPVDCVLVPEKLDINVKIKDIYLGDCNAIFIDENNNLWGLGKNSDYELGMNTNIPIYVPTLIPDFK